MVASLSARGGVAAAVGYYSHLSADGYYTRDGEPPGCWAGAAAERLGLQGPVTRTAFEAALQGRDPLTGQALIQQQSGRAHAVGWDMTFSAPKSVSVLWALSPAAERQGIEDAHRTAVRAAISGLEGTAAWTRRGAGGRLHEQTAGLLTAQFEHHTSRDADPQLHTHSFIFNLAPRRDGSWGTIVSRALYHAQKQAGATYRNQLADELERRGYALDRQPDNFRVSVIPREAEQAFSKRRQAIMEAAQTHGYNTPKGMELAALRTRRAKEEQTLDRLFDRWREEAKALGFTLEQDPQARRAREVERLAKREQSANQQQQAKPDVRQPQREARAGDRTKAGPPEAGRSRDRATISAPPPAQRSGQTACAVKSPPTSSQQLATADRSPAEIGALLGAALLALDLPGSRGGLAAQLHDKSAKEKGRLRSKRAGQEYEAE